MDSNETHTREKQTQRPSHTPLPTLPHAHTPRRVCFRPSDHAREASYTPPRSTEHTTRCSERLTTSTHSEAVNTLHTYQHGRGASCVSTHSLRVREAGDTDSHRCTHGAWREISTPIAIINETHTRKSSRKHPPTQHSQHSPTHTRLGAHSSSSPHLNAEEVT